MISPLLLPALLPIFASASAIPKRASNTPNNFAYGSLSLRTVGARNTLDWRVWLEKDGRPISFWHDIPLYPDESDKRTVNFVVEVPRWEDAKIEIRRQEPLNPIFHDDRNGLPRFVQSVFPHKTYPFLYGSIPQTWESPNFEHPFTGEEGDNDPMDLFDIGQAVGHIGQVKQVKILGALAVNDGGETDWKVLAIDVNDPLAALVDNYDDVEKYRPGTISAFKDWWTYYKIARGDDVIPIIGGWYQNSSFTETIIAESHQYWLDLIQGNVDGNSINYNQTSHPEFNASYVDPAGTVLTFEIPPANELPGEPKPAEYEEWYYLLGGAELIEVPGADGED